jgi:sulfate transport system permease protein
MNIRPFALTAHTVLPGYPAAMGYTLLCLFSVVLLPLIALVWSATHLSMGQVIEVLQDPRVFSAFWVSISAAIGSAIIAAILGLMVAWMLVRYRFPGKGYWTP